MSNHQLHVLLATSIALNAGCDKRPFDAPRSVAKAVGSLRRVDDSGTRGEAWAFDRLDQDASELQKRVNVLAMRIVEAVRNRDVSGLRELAFPSFDAKERVEYLHYRLGKGDPKFVELRRDHPEVAVQYTLDFAPEGEQPAYAHVLRLTFQDVDESLLLANVAIWGW